MELLRDEATERLEEEAHCSQDTHGHKHPEEDSIDHHGNIFPVILHLWVSEGRDLWSETKRTRQEHSDNSWLSQNRRGRWEVLLEGLSYKYGTTTARKGSNSSSQPTVNRYKSLDDNRVPTAATALWQSWLGPVVLHIKSCSFPVEIPLSVFRRIRGRRDPKLLPSQTPSFKLVLFWTSGAGLRRSIPTEVSQEITFLA